MYAYVLRNSCCTCFFLLYLFVIICDFFFPWYNKKDTMTKKKIYHPNPFLSSILSFPFILII